METFLVNIVSINNAVKQQRITTNLMKDYRKSEKLTKLEFAKTFSTLHVTMDEEEEWSF